MDEHTLKNEVNNQQGLIQAVNQGIYNSPITQNFYNSHEQIWNTQIYPIKDLRLESFKLGDDAAANFPYLIDPLREVYSQALQALQEASDPIKRIKGGILLLGESNAGKTRLALEALKQVLPEWLLLRWQPYYTSNHIPPIQALREKPLVLLLDDLHEYVSLQISSMRAMNIRDDPYLGMAPSFENPHVTALRALLETLLQVASNVVIVATCRNEYLESVNAQLGDHLLIRLRKLHLPSFNSNSEDSQVKLILAAFQQEGPIHLEDWDGTIGSLVLGLSRKHDQYISLPEYAQIVLKAIKLLAHAAIFAYPEQYIRKICISIFPSARNLQEDELWQDTIEMLLHNQFLIEDSDKLDEKSNLTIRSDSYLEKVISDYPPSHHSARLEQDLSKLLEVLSELGDAGALSNLAFSFSMRGRPIDALQAFEKALALDPSNSKIWRNKGKCLLDELDRYEEALEAYEQAITFDTVNTAALIGKGNCLIKFGRTEEALQIYEQVLVVEPTNIYAINNKGNCLLQQEQYGGALLLFERALELDPTNRCLDQLGNCEKALFSYEEVLKLDSTNVAALINKGAMLGRLERYEEALRAFDDAITLDPTDNVGWINKSVCLEKLGRHEEALQTLLYVQNVNQLDVDLENELFQSGYGEDTQEPQSATLKKPDNSADWYHKGIYLGRRKQHKEAITAFDQALSLDPTNSAAWYGKGYFLEQLERHKEALIAFKQSLDIDPDNVAAWYGKSQCLEQLEQYEEAVQTYGKALALDPKNSVAWFAKGYCHEWLKQYEEALYAYERSLALDPDHHAAIWNSKGFCLGELGKPKEALEAFERSISLDPNFAPAWANKGRCLQLLGRYTEAVEASEKAHLLDASYPVIEVEKLKQYGKSSYSSSNNTANSNKWHNKKKHRRKMQQQSRKANHRKR